MLRLCELRLASGCASGHRVEQLAQIAVAQAGMPSRHVQRNEAPIEQPGRYRADSETIPSAKIRIDCPRSQHCLPFLDLNAWDLQDQLICQLTMRPFSIALLTAMGLLAAIPAVDAKTTRSFSGSSPAEVEKNARKAGFSYPDGDMNCSSRCSQRWAKD